MLATSKENHRLAQFSLSSQQMPLETGTHVDDRVVVAQTEDRQQKLTICLRQHQTVVNHAGNKTEQQKILLTTRPKMVSFTSKGWLNLSSRTTKVLNFSEQHIGNRLDK